MGVGEDQKFKKSLKFMRGGHTPAALFLSLAVKELFQAPLADKDPQISLDASA